MKIYCSLYPTIILIFACLSIASLTKTVPLQKCPVIYIDGMMFAPACPDPKPTKTDKLDLDFNKLIDRDIQEKYEELGTHQRNELKYTVLVISLFLIPLVCFL